MTETKGNAAIIGRKTFFIGADPAVLPEVYLENFTAQGYETYRILETHGDSLMQKLELITALFKGSILFFYIDGIVNGLDWAYIIQNVMERHRDDVSVGVMYNRRGIEGEKAAIERRYARMGVQCGCLPLSYQRQQNFSLMDAALAANNAGGRRKTVRALCSASSTAVFFIKGQRYTAAMQDISLNHFSCIFPHADMAFMPYEKFEDVLLQVNGIRFRADSTLCMQRQTAHGMLFVFMFTKTGSGSVGLDDGVSLNLCTKIYQMVTEPTKQLLQDAFALILKHRRDVLTPEALCERVVMELRMREARKRGKDERLSA